MNVTHKIQNRDKLIQINRGNDGQNKWTPHNATFRVYIERLLIQRESTHLRIDASCLRWSINTSQSLSAQDRLDNTLL